MDKTSKRKTSESETSKPDYFKKTFSNLAIVTHESFEPTFNSCFMDDLTEYWANMRFKGISLHSYVCVPNAAHQLEHTVAYDNGLKVVARSGHKYSKTLVDRTSRLKHIPCDVMIISCHGDGGSEKSVPECVFCDSGDDVPPFSDDHVRILSHKDDRFEYAPALHDVVDKARLVVLLCCRAGEIARAYFTNTRDKQTELQLAFFDCDDCLSTAIEILLSWVVDLVECPPYDNYASNFTQIWRAALVRVMQIVRTFGDDSAGRFWDYLTAIGLVSTYYEVKRQQQLPTESEYLRRYRVTGHKMSFLFDEGVKQKFLNQFKTLTMATRSTNEHGAEYMTTNSPALPPISLSASEGVDTFLKVVQSGLGEPAKKAGLTALLAQLRTL